MKAEHRKELQTNVLADRMGRLVQGMKHRPRKRVVLYVIAAAVICLAVFFVFRSRQLAAQDRSEQWAMLEDGFKLYMDKLRAEFPETNAGKAARFQYAWMATWDLGLKRLGADPVQSLDNLEVAEKFYKKLAEDCAGDKVWEPEALYAIAIIEETRALRKEDRDKHLEAALATYKKLASAYKDSAHGRMAQKRIKLLENKDKAREILDFYADMDVRLQVEKRMKEAAEFEKLKAKFNKQ